MKKELQKKLKKLPNGRKWGFWLMDVAKILKIDVEIVGLDENGNSLYAFGEKMNWSKFRDKIFKEIEKATKKDKEMR